MTDRPATNAEGLLVFDAGGVSAYVSSSDIARDAIERASTRDWRVTIPAPVLVESLQGDQRRDFGVNRLVLATKDITVLDEPLARAAAVVRSRAPHVSATDAVVAAVALRHDGPVVVLTSDIGDLGDLLAGQARVALIRT